jgi:hypothetical protein
VSERLSKFAKIDVLGIDKYDFLSEYGDPESKDLEEIEGGVKEDLYLHGKYPRDVCSY